MPLIVQTVSIVLLKSLRQAQGPIVGPWNLDVYGLVMIAASSIVGFAFIVRSFKWIALVAAIAYFPAMFVALFYYSFVVGAVYGDFL